MKILMMIMMMMLMMIMVTVEVVMVTQDGMRIAESPRWKLISEDDHYTLLIYEVRPEDAGKFDCTVANKHGKTTCSARLNVVGMYWTPTTPSHLHSFSLLRLKLSNLCVNKLSYPLKYSSQ